MISIIKAGVKDSSLLSDISVQSFMESHGHSALPEDIDHYVNEKLNPEVLQKELEDPANIYHIIYQDKKPAGFSKIIFNALHPEIGHKTITKLERIYLLREFYGSQLGKELFHFNLELSKRNAQTGMWLYVWTENERAVRFYKKNGFKAIGRYDFKISENHSNPNYLMWLEY